jgi:hypothetical protein
MSLQSERDLKIILWFLLMVVSTVVSFAQAKYLAAIVFAFGAIFAISFRQRD